MVSPCKTQPKRSKNVKNPKIILNHRDLLCFVFADFCSAGSVTGRFRAHQTSARHETKRLTEHLTQPEFWWIVSIRNYPTCVFLTPQYRSLFKVKMWKNCLEISFASFRAAFRFPQNRVSLQFQSSPRFECVFKMHRLSVRPFECCCEFDPEHKELWGPKAEIINTLNCLISRDSTLRHFGMVFWGWLNGMMLKNTFNVATKHLFSFQDDFYKIMTHLNPVSEGS